MLRTDIEGDMHYLKTAVLLAGLTRPAVALSPQQRVGRILAPARTVGVKLQRRHDACIGSWH